MPIYFPVLNELLCKENSVVNTKTSVYNTDIYMDTCEICNSSADETHHINEQCNADKNNMINHFHKNKKHNLVPLCKQCHLNVTHGKLLIHGWIETSNGRQLNYEFSNKINHKKKYKKEQIDIIKSFKSKIDDKSITKTQCINMIDSQYKFRPSIRILNDILSDNY